MRKEITGLPKFAALDELVYKQYGNDMRPDN